MENITFNKLRVATTQIEFLIWCKKYHISYTKSKIPWWFMGFRDLRRQLFRCIYVWSLHVDYNRYGAKRTEHYFILYICFFLFKVLFINLEKLASFPGLVLDYKQIIETGTDGYYILIFGMVVSDECCVAYWCSTNIPMRKPVDNIWKNKQNCYKWYWFSNDFESNKYLYLSHTSATSAGAIEKQLQNIFISLHSPEWIEMLVHHFSIMQYLVPLWRSSLSFEYCYCRSYKRRITKMIWNL